MREMENNILSVTIFLISKQEECSDRCMVDDKCQEIAYFYFTMLHKKNASFVLVHIMHYV